MSNGEIPINAGDLPVDTVLLEESGVYPCTLERATVSMKPSKKGVLYCAVQVSVTEGDFEGQMLTINYLPLPVAVGPDASKKERILAMNVSAPFGRFCRSFKITGVIPSVSLSNPDSIRNWQDWIEKFYGNNGKVTIRNQEFPEGSGRQRSSLSDFVF